MSIPRLVATQTCIRDGVSSHIRKSRDELVSVVMVVSSARVSSFGPSKVRTSRPFAAVYGHLGLLVALEMLRQLRGRPSHGQLLPCLVHSHASLPTVSCIYQRAFLISSNKSSGFFCFELRRASPGGVPLPLASAAAATSASTSPKALWLGLHLLAGASGGDSWLRCPAGRTCPSAASFF